VAEEAAVVKYLAQDQLQVCRNPAETGTADTIPLRADQVFHVTLQVEKEICVPA